MTPHELLEILSTAEKLKCNTRHCFTSSGRKESVAEHCWRLSFMALLLEDEFKSADINKVIKMCIIHDLGEAFTGDIPVFKKKDSDRKNENDILKSWIKSFPKSESEKILSLIDEMERLESEEAKIYKSLDSLEAVIQHNESDIKTWLPLEYDLQLNYGTDRVEFSPYMKALKKEINDVTLRKIAEEGSI